MTGSGHVDVPVYIPSRGQHLGAVVTVPARPSESATGVLLVAGRARDRTHRNGTWVATAHALADRGLYALRLDYPGVGHSTGGPQVFALEDPPTWAVVDASSFLTEHTPVDRVLLAGSCFGGRLVMQAAPDIPQAAGVAMAAIPVATRKPSWKRRVRRAILGKRRRQADTPPSGMRLQQHRERNPATGTHPSRPFARAMGTLVSRNVPLYFLYGEDDFTYEEFRAAQGPLRLRPEAYDLDLVPGSIHAFASLHTQDLLRDRLVDWAAGVAARVGAPAQVPSAPPARL